MVLCASVASAQEFPTRPVRMIAAFPPGGPVDIQARLIAQKMAEGLKQPVIVDNRPGADGTLANAIVAKATPDGYTILITSIGITTTANLYPSLPYDPVKDFAPISQTTSGSNILAAHPSVAAKTLSELIALARREPDKLNFASAGIGSVNHLGMELLSKRGGIRLNHVPYKGAAPATTELLAGHVQLMLNPTSNALPHVRSGKLRGLAVTPKRLAAAPELPAISETLSGLEITSWYGILAPAGTSPRIVDALNREIVKALALSDVRTALQGLGLEPVGSTPREFGAFIQAELRKWGQVVRDAGIKLE